MSLCPEIGRLHKLEQLDISGNPIQQLPLHIAGCRGLEILNASACELVEIPEEFTMLTRLIELNLSNNQIPVIPEGVGRMTRLTVLNLMFNQLKDLPITIGFCVGLAKLGSGITIANNPIENPDMWKKYQIGTDHLFDYLEKRLTLFGENNIEFPEVNLPPELLEWEEGSRRQPRNNANQNYQQLVNHSVIQSQQQQSPPQQRGSPQQHHPEYNSQQQQYIQQQQQMHAKRAAQPVDVVTDLTTKTVVLKNWSINAIRGDLKPKMVKLGNFIARTTDIRSVTQATEFAGAMRPHVDKAKAYLANQPPPPRPAPVVLPGGDKMIPLRHSASVVVDDINFMLGAFFGLLQQVSDVNVILGIVGFLKEVIRELSYLQIAYQ